MTFFDVLIIVLVVVGIVLVGMYYFSRKNMRRVIQAQDFVEQNRTTMQIFIIDKKQEKPTASNLPKGVYEQMPKSAKLRKANLVRAKIGPQIMTLMCDKPVYDVLPVKKTLKVDLAGIYIVSIPGMNLADKKNKTFSEKISAKMSSVVSGQEESGDKKKK